MVCFNTHKTSVVFQLISVTSMQPQCGPFLTEACEYHSVTTVTDNIYSLQLIIYTTPYSTYILQYTLQIYAVATT